MPLARVLRDLQWAVASPPLLLVPGDERFPNNLWFTEQGDVLTAALGQLAQDEAALSRLAQAQRLRLGGYFEQLLIFWLEHSPRYQLLAHNLQVPEQGITQGAFDFIVRDLNDQAVEHWEVACKFYLQDGPSEQLSSWFGPSRKDKLEFKLGHLLKHQIALSNSILGRETLATKGWPVSRHKIIVKGRLFGHGQTLPAVCNPQALRGWLTSDQRPANSIALQRQDWLSPIQADDLIHGKDETTALRSQCLCVAKLHNHQEQSRGFVVPKAWFGSAPKTSLG